MTWSRWLLWVNGALFVGYGVACLISPALPAGYAGFALSTPSGTVEVVAMYGGLQIGFGVLVLMGATRLEHREPALRALAVVLGALCMARLIGIAIHGASTYNLAAAAYEATAASLSVLALRSETDREPAS